jgi:retinol-binding protein 3
LSSLRSAGTVVLLAILWTARASAQVPIPDTPAGRTLHAWLDAFNSGDSAQLANYAKTVDSSQTVDQMRDFRARTGGFDLVSIDSSADLFVRFRVKERASPAIAAGVLRVRATEPVTVQVFDVQRWQPGTKFESVTLDSAYRRRIINRIATQLKEGYVYPETADKMVAAIRAHEKQGDYDVVTDGETFAALLATHLRDVSHDKHLWVQFSPYTQPADAAGPGRGPLDTALRRHNLQRINCGFEKVEILPNNIGYVKFNFFGPPAICGATATAAMGFLAHVDAIIFDLRENHGGDPAMVQFVASYLFDQRTHLNDLYNRKENTTTQYWTLRDLPGTRLAGTRAFVLTSSSTFSGAEEFAYDLKMLKRATIVGERTGGGAHPVSGVPIDDHFTIGVPFARAVNPITKTDWEGTGVEPDVAVPAAAALDSARQLATKAP